MDRTLKKTINQCYEYFCKKFPSLITKILFTLCIIRWTAILSNVRSFGDINTAVECRTLDRENPVTNPPHIMAPSMATRCGGVTPQQDPCTVLGHKL